MKLQECYSIVWAQTESFCKHRATARKKKNNFVEIRNTAAFFVATCSITGKRC